jgi:CheY-like chemotaxis protein
LFDFHGFGVNFPGSCTFQQSVFLEKNIRSYRIGRFIYSHFQEKFLENQTNSLGGIGLTLILFVDDEPGLRDLAKEYLEATDDFRVHSAGSAADALNALADEEFDVVVADYFMPAMTGIDLLKRMREEGNETPFIIFTGKGNQKVVIEALNLGADYYIKKGRYPRTQLALLRDTIEKAVRQKNGGNNLTNDRSAPAESIEVVGKKPGRETEPAPGKPMIRDEGLSSRIVVDSKGTVLSITRAAQQISGTEGRAITNIQEILHVQSHPTFNSDLKTLERVPIGLISEYILSEHGGKKRVTAWLSRTPYEGHNAFTIILKPAGKGH